MTDRSAPVSRTACVHGVEDRQVEMCCAAFARRDAANDLGAVRDALLSVECAFLAGEALNENTGVFVNENAHRASLTTFSAASFIPSATVKFSPRSQNLLALFDVGSFQTNHDRQLACSARAPRSPRRAPPCRSARCRRKY